MRDGALKQLLAKQLGGLLQNDPTFLDLKTGQLKSKKPKKVKTPEEEAVAELKKLDKKCLGSVEQPNSVFRDLFLIQQSANPRWKSVCDDLGQVLDDFVTYNVLHSTELVPLLCPVCQNRFPIDMGYTRAL